MSLICSLLASTILVLTFQTIVGDIQPSNYTGTVKSKKFCETDNELVKNCLCDFIYDDSNSDPYLLIDCSYVNITDGSDKVVPDNVFELVISHNLLTKINNSEISSKSLKKLYLNDNLISDIVAGAFEKLPALQKLDLSKNKISNLDPLVFTGLQNLVHLDLSGNNLKKFAQYTFKALTGLQNLCLDDNPIAQYLQNASIFSEQGLALNQNIKYLSLEGLGMVTVPENFFSDSHNLRVLSLARNPLHEIPDIPYTIEELDISNTLISNISQATFANMAAMKDLKLNELPNIRSIEENTFSSMKGLNRLQLIACTNLSYFSPLAFGREILKNPSEFSLSELSFRGSQLTTLGGSLEPIFDELEVLELQGNPWNCDCNILWLKKMQISQEKYDFIRCNEPSAVFNKRLFELKDEEMSCEMPLLAESSQQNISNRFVVILTVFTCLTVVGLASWLAFILPRYSDRKYFLERELAGGSSHIYNRMISDTSEEIEIR